MFDIRLMQAIWDIVQRGPASLQEMAYRLANKDETFRAFKKMNNKIINRAVGIEGTPEIRYAEDLPFVFSCFGGGAMAPGAGYGATGT